MGLKCENCNGSYKPGPDGTLIHSCAKTSLNYRVTQDGKPIPGHNHPGSFVVRDKSTSATKPDTAESKKKTNEKEAI